MPPPPSDDRRCVATTWEGERCRSWRYAASDKCWKHTTNRMTMRQYAAIEEMAKITLGAGKLDVSPAVAMLQMVQEAAWNVEVLREAVSRLAVRSALQSAGEGDEAATLGGETVLAVSNWKTMEVDEHPLVKMYDRERDRLVRYAKLCRDARVDERMVQLAESTAAYVVMAVDAVLADLELTEAQRERLPSVMGRVVDELERG